MGIGEVRHFSLSYFHFCRDYRVNTQDGGIRIVFWPTLYAGNQRSNCDDCMSLMDVKGS